MSAAPSAERAGERLHLLERYGGVYGRLNLAVAFTRSTSGDAAKRCGTGWDRTKPLPDADFGAGLLKGRGQTRNPAVVLRPSRLVGIECDGRAALERLRALGLPRTVTVQSSAPDRLHFWYRAANGPAPEFVAFRFEPAGVTADTGRYLLCPPALHPSGAIYSFLRDPEDTEIAVLPDEKYRELVRLARGDAHELRERLKSDPGAKIPEGQRRHTVFRVACSQRAFGVPPEAILDTAKALNRARCEPPLTDEQVGQQVAGALRYPEATTLPGARVPVEPSDSRPENGAGTPLVERDSQAAASAAQAEREPSRGQPSQATQLVDLAGDVELFHTPDGLAFATLELEGHRETWPLRTRQFKSWLGRRFYLESRRAPNAQALQDALGVLEGRALFESVEEPVFVRLAEHGGAIYLDLGDAAWRAVEITSEGWEVVEAPVRFRRPNGTLALPEPVRGGEVSELREFVNVADADWPLLAGWLVASLRPRGPYPVLALHGEAGTAKSTTARVLRALVDPNAAPLRAQPREDRDLMIAARNGWLLAFDNLSHLADWLSDAFCRLSTGGGLATRALYTDTDEVLFDAQRPVLVTGIEELATRGDLLDRALVLYLPAIADEARLAEAEFDRAFARASGRLLGALLDGVAVALRREADLRLGSLPRMADFARWAAAAEPGLGFTAGTFMAAYADNRAEANELTLEASPIARLVRELAAESAFLGTATELHRALGERAGEDATRQKAWPRNGRALSGALRRIAPNLRVVGVGVEFGVAIPGSKRGIRLRSGATGANGANRATHSERPA